MSAATARSLDDLMSFGHPVYSDGSGNVTDGFDGPGGYVPESVFQELDADGQCVDDVIHDLPTGWEMLSGFTGQYSYNGPVMHPSEYIGGALERHIRENAGYYVAVTVDGLEPDEDDGYPSIGWGVAFRGVTS